MVFEYFDFVRRLDRRLFCGSSGGDVFSIKFLDFKFLKVACFLGIVRLLLGFRGRVAG